MKKSKILILLITITFPVILYLFLKSYGQNEYNLPVFFEEEDKLFCNNLNISASNLELIDLKKADFVKLSEIYSTDYKVIHFPNTQDAEIQTLKNELNRVLNTFDRLSINILSLQPINKDKVDQLDAPPFLSGKGSTTYFYPEESKDSFVNCIYAFPTNEWDGKHPTEETIAVNQTLVLLDEENKIRGYYDGYETKEVDRLILEIRVLLSNQ